MITYITNIVVKKDRTWNLKHRNKYREPGAVVMVTNCRHCDADLVAGW